MGWTLWRVEQTSKAVYKALLRLAQLRLALKGAGADTRQQNQAQPGMKRQLSTYSKDALPDTSRIKHPTKTPNTKS